ncbi:MAG: substrate-binding domain-containing protein [Pirellula sp.]|jgi:phosphate transport system substrate-binding protein|nr:substrate-binding domain-containing protein [Pirellula sp.]
MKVCRIWIVFSAVILCSSPRACFAQSQEEPVSIKEAVATETPHEIHYRWMQILDRLEPYRPTRDVKASLDLSGSSTMLDLGKTWLNGITKFHPNLSFTAKLLESEDALIAFEKNPKLVAGITRLLSESDLQRLQKAGCKEPAALIIGFEGLAVFVHESNKLSSLTQDQLKSLYVAGEGGLPRIRDWSDLIPGTSEGVVEPRSEIHLYERDTNSGTQSFLKTILFSGADLAKPYAICATNTEIVDTVARDPQGIGIADLNSTLPGVKKVPLVVHGHAVDANETNVVEGRYPLVRPLFLLFDRSETKSDDGAREAICRFVLSKEGQKTLMSSGFFPVEPAVAADQLQVVFGGQVR